jgi:hypothetical protein
LTDEPKHLVMKVENRADERRRVSLMADARQKAGHVDLLTMGKDCTETYRTWLVRMTTDEAEQYALNILEMVRVSRAGQHSA